MSGLDRVTGIKHLRVRGMRPVRVAAALKATPVEYPAGQRIQNWKKAVLETQKRQFFS